MNTPGALQEIRIEILNCVKRDGKLDLDRVSEECPLLNAAWYEVIRFANTDAMRMVEEPVIIGSKLIQKGTKIYLPYRQLHRNKAIFGEDVDSLNIKRFLNNDMSRNLSYKPFGGGTSICPGRYIARKESLAFIALVLHMYDLEFDGPTSGVPKLDTRKPALGLSDPVDADKILAIIKPRA